MTYSSITGVCILTAMVPFVWVAPTWHDIAFGVLIGVASTAGQWIVGLAFRYADASVLAPFQYTQLLWVSILGFLVFSEVPDIWTISGAAFIVASGLYTPRIASGCAARSCFRSKASRRRMPERALRAHSCRRPCHRYAVPRAVGRESLMRAIKPGSAIEYFTWLSAKLDSIEAMPSSRVSLFFRNAS